MLRSGRDWQLLFGGSFIGPSDRSFRCRSSEEKIHRLAGLIQSGCCISSGASRKTHLMSHATMAQHVNTCLFSGSFTKMTSPFPSISIWAANSNSNDQKVEAAGQAPVKKQRPQKSERRTTSVKRSTAVQHFRLMSWTLRDPSPTPGLRCVTWPAIKVTTAGHVLLVSVARQLEVLVLDFYSASGPFWL